MIGEKIVYAILFLAEAVTAWPICKLYLYCKEKSYIHVYKFYIGIPTPFCRRSI